MQKNIKKNMTSTNIKQQQQKQTEYKCTLDYL